MADKTKVIKIIQARLRDTDNSYVNHVEAAIEAAWGMIAKASDWWFLDQPTPYAFTVTEGEETITINKDGVGKMLYVANEYNRKLWTYLPRRSFARYREKLNDDTTGTVAVFTLRGLSGGKKVIQVHPQPNTGATRYLYYKEAGTLGNLDKLPDEWVKVLVHGAMSLLARPEQVGPDMWQAITTGEDRAFQYWLSYMVRQEEAVDDEDEDREIVLDPVTEDRLDDANTV